MIPSSSIRVEETKKQVRMKKQALILGLFFALHDVHDDESCRNAEEDIDEQRFKKLIPEYESDSQHIKSALRNFGGRWDSVFRIPETGKLEYDK